MKSATATDEHIIKNYKKKTENQRKTNVKKQQKTMIQFKKKSDKQ